jgi:putative NADH-flavin reductase
MPDRDAGPQPRRVTILGATGKIGSAALSAARAADLPVTVLTRDPASGLAGVRIVVGSLVDRGALTDALAESDAVIAAVGPRHNHAADADAVEAGMRMLTQAMDQAGVLRLVALSGAGIEVPGDDKPLIDRALSRFVRVAARHVVAAKQREYAVFSATDLEWTALRPAIVQDGSARGYRLSAALTPGSRTTRADVGQALVDQLTDRTFIRASPFVLPPAKG